MSQSCEDMGPLIAALADGSRTSAVEIDSAAAHLEDCEECRKLHDFISFLATLPGSELPTAEQARASFASIEPQVREILGNRSSRPPALGARPGRKIRHISSHVKAACLLLGCGLVIPLLVLSVKIVQANNRVSLAEDRAEVATTQAARASTAAAEAERRALEADKTAAQARLHARLAAQAAQRQLMGVDRLFTFIGDLPTTDASPLPPNRRTPVVVQKNTIIVKGFTTNLLGGLELTMRRGSEAGEIEWSKSIPLNDDTPQGEVAQFSEVVTPPADGLRRTIQIQFVPRPQALSAFPGDLGPDKLTFDVRLDCSPAGLRAYVPAMEAPVVESSHPTEGRIQVVARARSGPGTCIALTTNDANSDPDVAKVWSVESDNQRLVFDMMPPVDVVTVKAYAMETADPNVLATALVSKKMQGILVSEPYLVQPRRGVSPGRRIEPSTPRFILSSGIFGPYWSEDPQSGMIQLSVLLDPALLRTQDIWLATRTDDRLCVRERFEKPQLDVHVAPGECEAANSKGTKILLLAAKPGILKANTEFKFNEVKDDLQELDSVDIRGTVGGPTP